MSSKVALITGVNGQDGAYLSRFLLEKGYRVYGIIRTSADLSNLEFLGIKTEVDLLPLNLMDLTAVKKCLDKVKPDEIYNLAAQSSVGKSFKNPLDTINFNITSVMNLLEAIRTISATSKFYQASSSEMFGKVDTLPVTENTVLHPVSPYGISKATGHWMAVNYREAFGLFSCCGILFNHESCLRAMQFVTKKVLSTAVRISKGSKEKMILGNMTVKRDWGYAPEYVKAMWLMLQQTRAQDYVIATGEAHSLQEFVENTFSVLGLHYRDHLVTDENLYRPADIDIIYGDSQKANNNLGWRYDIPFSSLIETLIQEEIAYQEELQ